MSRESTRKAMTARRRARHTARSRRVVAAVVGSLVVALAAVGGVLLLRSEGPPASGSSGGRVSDQGGGAELGTSPGKRAPDFALTTTAGSFSLSEARGSTVVLDFMAPGCPSCAAEIPSLARAWKKFGDQGLTVVVVDVGGLSAQEAADYYRGELGGADHLYAGDKDFAVAESYEVRELGTTVIINRRGLISFRDAGVTDPDVLQKEIQKALS